MTDDRLARAALSRLTEPGDVRLASLVADLGAPAVYDHLRSERDVGGVLTEVAARLRGLDPLRELEEADARGIRFVVPGDAEWPAGLGDLERAEPLQRRGGTPLGLWLKGRLRLDEACARSVAIVGSRSATTYGVGVAGELGAELAGDGVTVVSGAAFGIDQGAHRGALAARGPTIAVLACGADRVYPAAHVQLLSYIVDEGLVVSEVPPGCAPTKLRFLSRNRLIAALSTGTVVVEAAVRSGALNTANWATRLNRVLMGVPGPVTSAPSEGVHELIRTARAVLVTRGEDVVELLAPSGSRMVATRLGERRVSDGLDEQELRVLDALPVAHGVSVASIARTAGLGEDVVRTSLTILARAGLAECVEGVWRIAGASPS
ncbi:MAG TPA: DNA-processing protein DprA [Nocardioidaceae bacterium]|nr:DNA-processing protein DprA [Nocardioidaceae bacterium]